MDPVILSIPIFFVLVGVELLWNWHRSRNNSEKNVYRFNDAVANISCGIIDQVTSVFAKVLTVGVYAWVYHTFALMEIPTNWFWFVVCFVAVDFCYYWSHRWSHGINFFWTGHVVHHQSEEYNLSVALRQGAMQKVLMLWVYLPLAVLGFSPLWFLYSIGFNLLYQFWIHTEAIEKMGWFERIFNTPSHHRVHHGRNPKYLDRNHAGVLIIWDKIFGSFQKEEEHPTYGITRPTKSFNPVWAHIQPFSRLFQDVAKIPGIKDKLRFLAKPPGWYPESMGGFQHAPAIKEPIEKFDVILPLRVNIYILIQYVLVVGITAGFLFGLHLFNQVEQAIIVAFILFYVWGLGLIFDRKPVAVLLDIVRLVFLLCAAGYIYSVKDWMIPALAVGLFGIISFVWLLMIKKNFNGKNGD